MTDWSALELCGDSDVLALESNYLNFTTNSSHWRASAKADIERRLRYNFRDRELATQASDVLDLISNPEVLKAAAACKTIELCARNNIAMVGDAWSEKARIYGKEFDREFSEALGMIDFDENEDNAIDDSEKYNVKPGIRLTRGGGLPSAGDVADEGSLR